MVLKKYECVNKKFQPCLFYQSFRRYPIFFRKTNAPPRFYMAMHAMQPTRENICEIVFDENVEINRILWRIRPPSLFVYWLESDNLAGGMFAQPIRRRKNRQTDREK